MSKTKQPNELIERHTGQLKIIDDINRLIGMQRSPTSVLKTTLFHLLGVPGFEAVQIYRLAENGLAFHLYLQAKAPETELPAPEANFPLDTDHPINTAHQNHSPVFISDKENGSELAVPFPLEKPPTILTVQSSQADAFSQSDIQFLSSLTSSLALIFQQPAAQPVTTTPKEKPTPPAPKKHPPSPAPKEQSLSSPPRTRPRTTSYSYLYDQEEQHIMPEAVPPPSLQNIPPTDQPGPTATRTDEGKGLVAPIQLDGQTIGLLGVEQAPEEADWSPDDVRLLEEVSSQVALAIENSWLLQQTQQRTEELTTLVETNRQLSETINLKQTYEILAAQVAAFLQADRCSILIFDREKTELRPMVTIPATDEELPPKKVEDSELFQKIKQSRVPEIETTEAGRQTLFPLLVRRNLIGLVQIEHQQPYDYESGELDLAQAIVSQGIVAIENAQLFEQTQNALSETQKLYEISRDLVEATTLEEASDVVIKNVRSYGVDRVSISLLDRDQAGEVDQVTIVASWDRESERILPVGSVISADTFSLVEAFAKPPFYPMISEDLSQSEGQDERMDEAFRVFMHEGLGAITLFSAPMFLGNEYKGVLSISTRTPHHYTNEEIRLYQTLADQAIVALERHRLFEGTRRERDRAAILFEFGQQLSQITQIEELEETVIQFTNSIGAEQSGLLITDNDEFFSMAITFRPDIPAHEADRLTRLVIQQPLIDQALENQKTVYQNRAEWQWQIEGLSIPKELNHMGFIPFQSQRSGLQGALLVFHTTTDGFTEDQTTLFASIVDQAAATLENVWLLHQTERVLNETELLYKATQAFSRAQYPEDLLLTLVESVALPTTGIEAMSIGLIQTIEEDGSPKEITITAHWDKSPAEEAPRVTNPRILLDSQQHPFIREITPQSPHQIDHDALVGTKLYLTPPPDESRSILCIPLTVGPNWLGILFLTSTMPELTFRDSIINQVVNLSGQAAVVLQNLELVQETQQNLYNSELLSQLSQELLGADTDQKIYQITLNAIAATEPERGAAIFMYQRKEDDVDLELVAIWNNPNREWPAVPPGTTFTSNDLSLIPILETGQTVEATDAGEDERFSEMTQQLLTLMEINSFVAVPIWLDKKVNGFILIANHQNTAFATDTIRLYENISHQTSSALQNLRLLAEAENRATQLETAADVSQAATSYLDLETLLAESVELIRARFGFYHVSIFLVDEYRQFAEIAASTGEVGQHMLAVRHKLRVGGRSIVGTATDSGKPRVVRDVGQEATHFNNPLLPETRSEIAIPLVARGQVIGALDAQSNQETAFSETELTILQSVANQLANAIEAARAFQESAKSLEEVSKLHEHYLRDEWRTFLAGQEAAIGYRLKPEGLEAIYDDKAELCPELIQQALEARHPLILPTTTNGDSDGDSGQDMLTPDTNNTLVAPLKLHGQTTIGAIDFELPERGEQDEAWEEDIRLMIEAISGQAAQAIEAARLFEQTQAAREEAEALYKVGRALVAIESEQAMFHAVLKEMLSTLGLKQGGILLFEEDRRYGRLQALFEDGQAVPNPDLQLPIEGNPSYEKLIETKSPLAIEDVATDPLLETVRDINLERNVASLLLVPILIEDEVIGAIGADSVGKKHVFADREINLASAMADQLSLMLQNRRLLDETSRRAIQLQTSFEVSRVATSYLEEETMLEKAVQLIRDRFGYYHVQVFLIDDAEQFAVLFKSTGQAGDQLLAQNYKVAIGDLELIGQVTFERKSMVVRDTDAGGESDLPFQYHELLAEAQATLGIPLQVGETLIGALEVHSRSRTDFNQEDIAVLEILAAQLSVAIQNARAFREQQETAERMREIDRLKTQFLANMSHELRTPLNSIIGFSRVILKGIDGPLTDLQKADLTSIHNSGQHLLGLINNILDLSKIEAGKMELNFEEVEVGPIIKQVMSTAIALVKDKEVELVQKIPDDMPIIWADPTRIRQVVLNLVSNAAKFTEEGEIVVKARADTEKIVISVSDTGIGIPEEKMGNVFEEFTQVDASTTRKAGGTGLGLPICRHFIEMHKGQIWVESTVGEGSTFSFAIPVQQSGEEADEDGEEEGLDGRQNGQEKTIVAIDDDPGVINLYKRFLEKRHYKIISVKNTDDVVARVKGYAPFVILLDILMPDKDGWAVLKELKEDPFTKDIPVIICSIVSDKNRGFTLGAADYLIKPIVEGELITALKQVHAQQEDQINVLVIDDQADDVLLIRRILEAHNYRIIEARNGKDGLDLAKTRRPNLIILDLNMPGMNGFTVVKHLKKDEKTNSIPIIIVSARELTPDEHEFLSGRIEVLLRKGIFTENELLEDVEKALERVPQA